MNHDQCPYANLFLTGWELKDCVISERDKAILREYGKRLQAAAARPEEAEKFRVWNALNKLEEVPPPVYMDPESGWHELVPYRDGLHCEGYMARGWETYLRKELFYAEQLHHDKPAEAKLYLPYCAADSLWGIREEQIGNAEMGDAITWKPPLADLDFDEIDLHDYISMPQITVDFEATNAYFDLARDVFDGILDVELRHRWWWSPKHTRYYADLRGLENLLYDFYDYPEQVHVMMRLFTDGFLKRLDYLEANGLLTGNSGNHPTPSGGIGITDQLNPVPGAVKAMDMWGFCESQETSEVSPQMFAEFVLPYQIEVAQRFGLNCYGCCEPLDARLEYVLKIPRLRRISCSPWACLEKMSERLGPDYILCYKPSPTDLAMPVMDEDSARQRLRHMLEVARRNNNRVEIVMKDNHTLGNNPNNAILWVQIAREEIARAYG